jgi:hypothetical protein
LLTQFFAKLSLHTVAKRIEKALSVVAIIRRIALCHRRRNRKRPYRQYRENAHVRNPPELQQC